MAAKSLNGWAVLSPGSPLLATKLIPGTTRKITMRRDVLPLFLALGHDYDDWVRSVDSGKRIDDAGYAYRAARGLTDFSNHASGTALDLNWSEEGARGSDWGKRFFANPANAADVDHILSVYQVIVWGGDWKMRDYMHWELARGTTLADVKRVIRLLGIDANGVRHNDAHGKRLAHARK